MKNKRSYARWDAPNHESCIECNWPILVVKQTKSRGVEKACPQKDCKYATPYECDAADMLSPKESTA